MRILTVFKDGDVPVIWIINDDKKHRIEYGKQIAVVGDSLMACRKFGEAVRHSLECSGAFADCPDEKDICWFCEGRGEAVDGSGELRPCPCC